MNGYGFSFLPTLTVQEELNSGSLVEFPICTRPTEIHAVCAHHSNKWISPAMKLFIELVTEQK
jgi:DNA-binding transcriptional LysR family regulator